jgi:hypothetical protein
MSIYEPHTRLTGEQDIGVMRPVDMQIFPSVYRAYKRNKKGEPFRETEAWKQLVKNKLAEHEQHSKAIAAAGIKALSNELEMHADGDLAIPNSRKVKVIGVWDTVGSLGVPDIGGMNNANYRAQYGFHNVKLNGREYSMNS